MRTSTVHGLQRTSWCPGQYQRLAPRLQRGSLRLSAQQHDQVAASSGAHASTSRRLVILTGTALLPSVNALSALAEDVPSFVPDTTITDKVYLDIGIASTAFKPAGERVLGDKTVLPDDAAPAGRIVLGLYGKTAPATVSNFLTVVRQGGLNGTCFSRISPGEYIQAGRQGARRQGELEVRGLQPNTDLSSAVAFKLPHYTPGTVSLSLSENDEDPQTKDKMDYRPTEFLITTGPGPVPRLDGLNVVFGRVLEGLGTVAAVSAVPSFQPDIRSQQLNRFAAFLGDDRADKVRRRYGRPLKAVIITGSGILEHTTPIKDPEVAEALAQQGERVLAAGSFADAP